MTQFWPDRLKAWEEIIERLERLAPGDPPLDLSSHAATGDPRTTPEAFIAPRELRDLRDLLRHSVALRRMRSALKNGVSAVWPSRPSSAPTATCSTPPACASSLCLRCVGSLMLVDRVGRRPLVIQSFVWAGLALLLLGIFPSATASIILVLFAAYALLIGGTQILQWIYPNELFPTEVRGSAVGLASSLSRIRAAIGTYLVPKVLDHLGIGPTMIVAAVITFVGAVASLAWAPETRGMTLGESSALGETAPSTVRPRRVASLT
jgi:Sugar (and other) transporter